MTSGNPFTTTTTAARADTSGAADDLSLLAAMHRVIPTRGPSLVDAAVKVLADGKPRDATAILTEAVAAGLLPAATRRITLYTSLSQYVQRSVAKQRKPLVVEDDVTHAFRINHPVDDWPEVMQPARAPVVAPAQIEAIAKRLHDTAIGVAPDAFEAAVCDAFALLGFVAQHVGGIGAPDGLLDAPLGPLGYRAVVECKSARTETTVNAPRLDEPAKFRDAYRAEFAVLAGPAFAVDGAFESEMAVHAVSVWTVSDIVGALRLGVDLLECRSLFAPGIVEDRLADLAWDRAHGERKRRAVIASLLHRAVWDAQTALVGRVAPADAPVLGADTALLLVDTALKAANAAGGATRAEIDTAIADLVRDGTAAHVPDRDGIVACTPPAQATS